MKLVRESVFTPMTGEKLIGEYFIKDKFNKGEPEHIEIVKVTNIETAHNTVFVDFVDIKWTDETNTNSLKIFQSTYKHIDDMTFTKNVFELRQQKMETQLQELKFINNLLDEIS